MDMQLVEQDYKLDPEVKAAWLAALRSGEYRQGRNRLLTVEDRSFCCLGVLCDLWVKQNPDAAPKWSEKGHLTPLGLTPASYPSTEILKWASKSKKCEYGARISASTLRELGIPLARPPLDVDLDAAAGRTPSYNLAEMNDVLKLTFEQIADAIEREA